MCIENVSVNNLELWDLELWDLELWMAALDIAKSNVNAVDAAGRLCKRGFTERGIVKSN
jgi:hypothetical protein